MGVEELFGVGSEEEGKEEREREANIYTRAGANLPKYLGGED